jgi:hypothetical protein
LTGAGDVVLADATTGKAIRTLVKARMLPREERFRSLTLSPDRKTLVFVVHHDDDCSDIGMLPMAGGPMKIIARGDSPTFSPDGRHLAYMQLLNCGGMRALIVVRDIATGKQRFWEEKGGDMFPVLAGVTWSPDANLVMVGACGADSCGPSILDIRSPKRDLWAETKPVPGHPDGGDLFWRCWTTRGRRGTVVTLTDYSSSDGSEPYPVLEVDLKTAAVRHLVPVGKGLGCFTFDAAGDHALFVREGVVHRWTPALTVPIRRGYTEAVW